MNLALGRFFGFLTVMFLFALNVVRTVFDLIGYTTTPADAVGVPQVMHQAIDGLLAVPWWGTWGVFLVCFLWITWLSFTPQHAAVGAERSHWETPKKPDRDAEFAEMMRDTARAFLKMAESLDSGDLPSRLPAWNAFKEHMITVQISMEKAGLTAPWLNPDADPIGWMERNGRYFNRIAPMIAAGHSAEAKVESKALALKLQNEHPGPNGRAFAT